MKNKILSLLKNSNEYISGEELSKKLNITRSAIWKYIKALKNEGYEIDSVTNKGYFLTNSKNAFNSEELENGLKTNIFAKETIFLKTVDSTNLEVKRKALSGAEHGLTVVSEEQTLGKGRIGKSWDSQKGVGLWFSILLKPDLAPCNIQNITLVAGLAVCKAVRSLTGCNAQIKWPNDVIIGKKKICGILTEMNAEADKINFAVVGIGINVNNEQFPIDISEKATSLYLETGSKVSRIKLLQSVLYNLENEFDEYMLTPDYVNWEEYQSLCATIGRNVKIFINNKEVTGTATGVHSTGGLLVELENGKSVLITSGEAVVQGIY